MAKNAGKTVAFNTILKEATEKKIRTGLVSYGRDGEETDILNRHEKPRIFIPPETIFVTTSNAYEKSGLNVELIFNTSIKTTLGQVGIYKTSDTGGNVELVGINSISGLKKIKDYIEKNVELLMVDGALDRKSSAIPEITQGIILATGSVLGNTEELVIKRTIFEIEKINLSEIKDEAVKKIIFENNNLNTGFLLGNNEIHYFKSLTSFNVIDELERFKIPGDSIIYLRGALTDSFCEKLCYGLKAKNLTIVLRDSTQIFLNQRNFNLLRNNNFKIFVLKKIKLLAITVNPISPYGVRLDSDKIISGLKKNLDIPVYDLLSSSYSF